MRKHATWPERPAPLAYFRAAISGSARAGRQHTESRHFPKARLLFFVPLGVNPVPVDRLASTQPMVLRNCAAWKPPGMRLRAFREFVL